MEYHESFWKSELIDFVILQQDAFDDIDASTPMERQQFMFNMILDICGRSFTFTEFEQCSKTFKQMINLFKQMNYQVWKSDEFESYRTQIEAIVEENSVKN